MKKKLFLFFTILFLSSNIFAASFADAANIDFKAMDIPLLDGMAYFMKTMDTFASIAGTLAIALFLVTICWNAFRLWFGTQQIRKAAVDIMLKCLLYTALILCYRGIQNGVLDLSMKIGSLAGGGADDLSIAFTDLAESLEQRTKAANEIYLKLMQNAGDNNTIFSEQDIEKLMKGFGKTSDEIKEDMNKYGVRKENYNSSYAGSPGSYTGGMWERANFNKSYSGMDKETKNTIKNMIKKGEVDRIVTIMNGIRDVFNEIEIIDPYSGIDTSHPANTQEYYNAINNMKSNVRKYLYSPFIKLSNREETNLWKKEDLQRLGVDGVMVSPGAMIKTSVLMGNLLFQINGYETKEKITEGKVFKSISWQGVFNFILLIIMTLTLVFSSIFCVIQYVMCVFEYFITTSIGILFVPCILFDGTKSFASKLITLFTSYFIKITVMLLCLFWVFSTYLRVGMYVATNEDGANLMMFAYLMFTVLLGFIVTQNAPQIAVTVLNGSPQLSMGEFLHAAGTVAAGAALANKAGKAAVATTQKVAKPIDGAVSGIAAAGAVAAGTIAGGGTKGQAFKKGLKTLGSAWGSGIVNSASRLVLGRDVAQTRSDTLGFKKGSAQTIHSNKVQSGEWKAEEAAKYGMLAGQDGKNTLGSIREAAKLDAVAEQRKKNPPPNDKNANGEGGSSGYNNPPKDTTEKVEDTRQS